MAGRLRSTRVADKECELIMQKTVTDMREEVKEVLWKIERSKDLSPAGLKGIVRKGMEDMSVAVEKAITSVSERITAERKRTEQRENEYLERIAGLEELERKEKRKREFQLKDKEERLRKLETAMEKVQQDRKEDRERVEDMMNRLAEKGKEWEVEEKEERERVQERLKSLEEEVRLGGKCTGCEESVDKERMRRMEERTRELENKVMAESRSTGGKVTLDTERLRKIEERTEEMERERAEKEQELKDKMRDMEERLEKERTDREEKEKLMLEERQQKEARESEKEMERKVMEAMVQVKILNLKFAKESTEKGELLKEVEGILKGKVKEGDKKECGWILKRSRIYILGKGTEGKDVDGERIVTAPVLLVCSSRAEKERMEGLLRKVGVRITFQWPKEMLEYVDGVRDRIERMGYGKEEFYVKVRPHVGDGDLQLRAEVKRKTGSGNSFRLVAYWYCPPLNRDLWGVAPDILSPSWVRVDG
jgi:hypothetical protein